jgi:hypothetical protein
LAFGSPEIGGVLTAADAFTGSWPYKSILLVYYTAVLTGLVLLRRRIRTRYAALSHSERIRRIVFVVARVQFGVAAATLVTPATLGVGYSYLIPRPFAAYALTLLGMTALTFQT